MDEKTTDSVFAIKQYIAKNKSNADNENDFDWDDFYAECSNLPNDMVLRCIPRIEKFGDSDDVVDAILSVSYPADDALYERAVACGVKFTKEQSELMGREYYTIVENTEAISDLSEEQTKNNKERKSSIGKVIGFGVILGLFEGLFDEKKKHRGRCDGDCANCPAHYGYRYGRWYYGHGHNHGCEFGGNKGGGGPD